MEGDGKDNHYAARERDRKSGALLRAQSVARRMVFIVKICDRV